MLTEPSPFVSSWLNTLSAWAMLVPPAPSAFSNSDLLTWPSLLVSSCENRFCSALDGLVGAELDVAAEDWPCAASSALIVAGESCENPFVPETGAGVAEGAALAV